MTRLTDAAEKILNGTIPKRIDIVYSQAHFDHIGASVRFHRYMQKKYPSAPIFILGTEEARELIQNAFSKRAIIPNVYVGKTGRTLTLDHGLKVEMKILGGHTATDLALYIPRHKNEASILMHVDLVFPQWAPAVNLGITTNFGKYIDAHKALLKKDFDVFVGGHYTLGNRMDVVKSLQFAQDLVEDAKNALGFVNPESLFQAGFYDKFTDPSAREFKNVMYAYLEVERRLQIDACYYSMLAKWGCTLGGLDLTLRGYCFTALTYLAIQY